MNLYSEGKSYKLYRGNMLDMLDDIAPNSISSVVTDPPYELGFMAKSWDNTGIAFQVDTWKKCFDVLKPGGYLLAFGGSRTFHRIACAIEDAGFEIRDTIMWLYGCYSADTQVLTNVGWKYFYELDRTESVLQWDKSTNKLSWVKPLHYFEYDIDDELCLFENKHISQLVTKNHKVACQVKARRKPFSAYQLIEAEDIKPSWVLNFPLAGELEGFISEKDAYIIGWWLTDAWKHKDGKACMFSQSKPHTLEKLRKWFDEHNVKYSEYIKKSHNPAHRDEHTFYVTGDLANKLLSLYPDRELTYEMLNWDVASRKALLEGLMDGDGSYHTSEYSNTFWSRKKERQDIVQALCISLNYRAYIGEKDCVIFNTVRNSTQTQTRHHKPNVPYKGKVYCLETETGAFVVRRNGRAFISGNSGFPKSMSISKGIEAKETYGVAGTTYKKQIEMSCEGDTYIVKQTNNGAMGEIKEFERKKYIPTSDRAKEWEGWGTCLKPAYEPIIVARKPCEGSCIDNVLTYGVGGINIDECRIPFLNDADYAITANKNQHEKFGTKPITNNVVYGDYSMVQPKNYESDGRFPSNVILTYDETDKEEVCGGMPDTKSNGGATTMPDFRDAGQKNSYNKIGFNDGDTAERKQSDYVCPMDEGSVARYFYCAKASKRDRNEGCESLEDKTLAMSNQAKAELKRGNTDFTGDPTSPKNNHPTVKPVSLMSYLVRLVTPKGGTILDPFNGSGSTGKAAMFENKDRNANYKYIGIELTPEYLPISKARIEYAINYVDVVEEKPLSAEKQRIINNQMSLFELP